LKLELLDFLLHFPEVTADPFGNFGILFLDCHRQHLAGVGKAQGQIVQRGYDGGQAGSLTAQCLRLFGIAPDVGIFQLPVYFFEPVVLVCVVKDTP
jgi:hypothetical protein